MRLLYKFLIFGLLLQNLLHFTATTENVNCDEDDTADTQNNLCYRNKVIEKYSRIESLKKEILSKLGLDEAPNITAPVLPTSMLEDFSSLQVASSTTHAAPYYAMPITTYIVQQTRHKFGELRIMYIFKSECKVSERNNISWCINHVTTCARLQIIKFKVKLVSVYFRVDSSYPNYYTVWLWCL